jgi:hypothetical protein
VILVFSILAGSRLQAATSEEEQLLQRGAKLREAGNERAAVIELQKAYDIAHSPKAAAQLGLAEWALGRWGEAEQHVSEALEAQSDPWLRDRKRRQVLEEAVRTIKSHLGSLEVTGSPEGAEVIVSGKLVGRLPLPGPVRVVSGEVEVEVQSPGYIGLSRSVKVETGKYERILVRLQEQTAAPAVSPVPAAQLAAGPEGTGRGGLPPAKPSSSSGLRTASYVVAGVGGAALITGLVFNLKANSLADGSHSVDGYSSQKLSDRSSYETAGWVGYGVGAACVATGAVLYLVGGRREQHGQSAASLLPVFSPGRFGAVLEGSF